MNLLINSSNEIYGACRHKLKFHRFFKLNNLSADKGVNPEKSLYEENAKKEGKEKNTKKRKKEKGAHECANLVRKTKKERNVNLFADQCLILTNFYVDF